MSSRRQSLTLHRGQAAVFRKKSRFKVIVAGRRWGKTQCAKTALIRAAASKKNQNVWYVAPTYKMARSIMWRELIKTVPRNWIVKSNETSMIMYLRNGSIIECKGADKPDCYDAETEILTQQGWVRFADLPRDVDVLTLNPETLKAEWHRPYKYVDQAYEGPMYRVASGRLDLMVTPDHKFLVENRNGKRKIKRIEDVSTHQDRIPARCGWDGVDSSAMSDEMCAIAGFYLAEGCAYGVAGGDRSNRGWPVFFSQTEGVKGGLKGDVRADFKKILNTAGFTYRENKIGLNVQSKALHDLLSPLGNKYTKRIPRDWLDLPAAKLRIMLHWMLMGDGSVRDRDIRYYTVSRGLADDVQELAIKAGFSANIVEKKQTVSQINGRDIVPTVPLWEVRIYRNEFNCFRDSKESYISDEWYAGRVYCVGVQNHVVMVRRNGKMCWSGNTLRGVALDFFVIDEAQDVRPTTFFEVLMPTLAGTRGDAMIIGTPKAFNWLYEVYLRGQRGEIYTDPAGKRRRNAWMSWQFPTITSPFIPPSEIEEARHNMDPRSFRQEFEASFETMSGRVYYAFDRKVHVKETGFDPRLPIWIGQDFNIDPMSSVIMQPQLNGEIHIIDEVVLFGSNTEEAGNELARRFFKYLKQTTIYPDPAGSNRAHTRGESDLDILREQGFQRIKFKRKHPPVADRVNAVNRMFLTADGTRRLFVNPKCKHTINALEQTIYKEGTREVDKSAGIEHAADALGYCIHFEFPVRGMEFEGISI